MCGRVAAVLFLSLLAVPALPQCNLTPQYSGQYRSSVLDAAVDGNDLWTATSYGVQLLDRRVDPPAAMTSIAIPGITRVVRASNGTAYAASGTRIAIVRRNGNALQLVRMLDLGATVNDLVLTTLYLYAATSNGIAQFDLLDPLNPARTTAALPTSSQNVTSLALNGSTLYAADGDLTIEQFSISVPALPQQTGTIEALPRSISVKVTSSRLYVSDGLQTVVIIGGTRAATLPFGGTSLVAMGGEVVFAAGTDRRLRAVDLTVAGSPVDLYATELVPSGGTINRFSQLVIAGGRLYGAAGDAGLLTLDVTGFFVPFPVRNFPFGAMTSISIVDTRVIASRIGGGLSDFNLSPTGSLTAGRQWDTRADVVQDGGNGFLLTSSGKTLTFWTLQSQTPVEVSTATFPQPVQSAVLSGSTAYAVLSDFTFWSADLTAVAAPVTRISVAGAPSMVARSGATFLLAELTAEGTTKLTYYASSSFAAPTATRVVDGVATTPVAFSGTLAAVFTFRGITLVDLLNGSSSVLPASNATLPRQLVFSGSSLLEATDRELLVWSTTTRTLARSLSLPSEPVALRANDTLAVLATVDGITSVNLTATTKLPAVIPTKIGNAYYRKAVAGGDRIYLFDGRGVDAFSVAFGAAPHFLASIRPPGVIDVAASSSLLFTLASGGVISAWSPEGVLLGQATLDEGPDVQPLAITTVKDAVWVSIAKGCLTAACEKKTIVLDPTALVRTATLTGGTIDATVVSNRAYALFDLPSEVRVLDVSDALHPTPLAARPTEGTQPPVSVAFGSGTVFVLGEKLYLYNDSLTAKTGEQFPAYAADPTGAVSYVDQRVRVDGACVFVTGRSFSPQFLTFPSFAVAQSVEVPAAVKAVVSAAGRLYLLTNYSLEVLSASSPPAVPRRRAAR
ncbi:MAG TPA: hypothetical protein VGR02_05150 [Thermoanaerobaculia bacterium]|jgi:hypothetical protein|nr:hypothetical protein [Thermoanaerobaculia bacterium]